MTPNNAWLDFIQAIGAEDNPHARSYFLAGFQSGMEFAERALHAKNGEAVEEIHKTVQAVHEAEYGRAGKA